MDPSRKGASRYNKVNQQKKFYLLTLIYKQHVPVREAAQIVGINYLTAKTIVFFYKNNHKTYQFDLENTHPMNRDTKYTTASVVALKKINSIQEKLNKPKSRIEVICSIGNILSPPVQNCEREGPPEEHSSKCDAAIETLPNNILVPLVSKRIVNWPVSNFSDGTLMKGRLNEGEGKFSEGEADKTRLFY